MYATAYLASSTITVLATAWDGGGAWGSSVAYDIRPVVSLRLTVCGVETHKLFPGHCLELLVGRMIL